MAQLVKNLPTVRETYWVGNGYTLLYSGLENSMDCIVSMGSQRVGHD